MTIGDVLFIFLLFMWQAKAPVEESRKKIWLVDSKVVENMIGYPFRLFLFYLNLIDFYKAFVLFCCRV